MSLAGFVYEVEVAVGEVTFTNAADRLLPPFEPSRIASYTPKVDETVLRLALGARSLFLGPTASGRLAFGIDGEMLELLRADYAEVRQETRAAYVSHD